MKVSYKFILFLGRWRTGDLQPQFHAWYGVMNPPSPNFHFFSSLRDNLSCPLSLCCRYFSDNNSINQSMFCFISVHTKVTLDNNCNTRYLQTCHHIVLDQPISLYGGTLKKWTKPTTLNKQTNKNTSKMNKTNNIKQTNKQKYKQQQTNKQKTIQDRQHMYCGTPLWKRFVKSQKRHKTGKTSVKCSIAIIHLTNDNRTHKLWIIQCTTIFFFFKHVFPAHSTHAYRLWEDSIVHKRAIISTRSHAAHKIL